MRPAGRGDPATEYEKEESSFNFTVCYVCMFFAMIKKYDENFILFFCNVGFCIYIWEKRIYIDLRLRVGSELSKGMDIYRKGFLFRDIYLCLLL